MTTKGMRHCFSVSVIATVIALSTLIVIFATSSSFVYVITRGFSTESSSDFIFAKVPNVQLRSKQADHEPRLFSPPHPATTTTKRVEKEGGRIERGLGRARAAIREAALSWTRNISSHFGNKSDDVINHDIYRNPSAFYQSYIEMERRFKVYVYEEGELPVVHDGPCKDIYSIEGRFLNQMENGFYTKRFKTKDPLRAHAFFMPFSVAWMVKYLYKPLSYDLLPLRNFVSDYVRLISTKHPSWNKTQGANHFMLSCHDWGPHATKGNADLYKNSVRVLCNANSSEGFDPQKDVSLPEIHLKGGVVPHKLLSPPSRHTPRLHLAFFAGGVHGPIRPFLIKHWKNRDLLLQVYEYLPNGLDYYSLMLQSKYCLCPSGYEVASPRIVEAVYAECVPVILSDHYVLPFSDVLRWEAFSIKVDVADIPRLKDVLMAVSEERYAKLKEGLRAVRKHFELNQPPKRFDVFHMILHSVWLRRINLKLV